MPSSLELRACMRNTVEYPGRDCSTLRCRIPQMTTVKNSQDLLKVITVSCAMYSCICCTHCAASTQIPVFTLDVQHAVSTQQDIQCAHWGTCPVSTLETSPCYCSLGDLSLYIFEYKYYFQKEAQAPSLGSTGNWHLCVPVDLRK